MLPCSVGRLLKLLTWEPVFPRIEWGFHMIPPYQWEVDSLGHILQEKNGHWFINNTKGKPVKGTCNGTPYITIIYWLYLGDELGSVHKLGTSCGESYCLNPEHILEIDDSEPEEVPVDNEQELVVNYVKGPPVFVGKNKTRRQPRSNNMDKRVKCITRKVWFKDSEEANKALRHPKMRSYKCNMCDGWHHTHKAKESEKSLRRKNRKMPYS